MKNRIILITHTSAGSIVVYEILIRLNCFFIREISTSPAAEPSGRFPPPLLAGGGDGDPPCALAYRRWGPIYIAVHTQRMELWVYFFGVLRLLIWWESQ